MPVVNIWPITIEEEDLTARKTGSPSDERKGVPFKLRIESL